MPRATPPWGPLYPVAGCYQGESRFNHTPLSIWPRVFFGNKFNRVSLFNVSYILDGSFWYTAKSSRHWWIRVGRTTALPYHSVGRVFCGKPPRCVNIYNYLAVEERSAGIIFYTHVSFKMYESIVNSVVWWIETIRLTFSQGVKCLDSFYLLFICFFYPYYLVKCWPHFAWYVG